MTGDWPPMDVGVCGGLRSVADGGPAAPSPRGGAGSPAGAAACAAGGGSEAGTESSRHSQMLGAGASGRAVNATGRCAPAGREPDGWAAGRDSGIPPGEATPLPRAAAAGPAPWRTELGPTWPRAGLSAAAQRAGNRPGTGRTGRRASRTRPRPLRLGRSGGRPAAAQRGPGSPGWACGAGTPCGAGLSEAGPEPGPGPRSAGPGPGRAQRGRGRRASGTCGAGAGPGALASAAAVLGLPVSSPQ